MATEIKTCTLTDLTILQKLSIETYTDTFAKFNTASDLEDYLNKAYNTAQLTQELTAENTHFYFLYLDKQLAGYLKINILDSQSEAMGNDFLEIERIYIRKQFKRRGLGKLLLEFALEKAKQFNKDKVWLGVWENNLPAQKFYQFMGFKRYSSHHFVMGTSVQTDYILTKELRTEE